jgi:heat shock protein HslJ
MLSSDRLRLLSNKGLPIESGLPYELRRLREIDRLDGGAAGGSQAVASLCFGNEPSWSLDLSAAGEARLAVSGERPAVFRGRFTRDEARRERLWRGTPALGRGGDLVAFLAETACSDGMSDTRHPVTVRVSSPDGRFLVGCCRVPGSMIRPAAGAELEGVTWRVVDLPGFDAAALGAARQELTLRFADGRVAGFAGCNRFSGSYRLDGERLSLGSMAVTRMACPEPAMTLERAFLAAFTGDLRVALHGDRLDLVAAGGRRALTARRAAE